MKTRFIVIFFVTTPFAFGQDARAQDVGTCFARPPVTKPLNYYDLLPNRSDRQATQKPGGDARGDGRAQHVPTDGATDRRPKNQVVMQGGTYGQNNIQGTYDLFGNGGPPNYFVEDINGNYFGGGDITTNLGSYVEGYGNYLPSPAPNIPTFFCSDGLDKVRPKPGKPQILSFDTATCDATFAMGKSYIVDGLYHDAFDTLQYYIEHCYSDPFSCQAFSYLEDAFNSDSTGGSASIPAYRDWLFSVLYLSMDTQYYCADAQALMVTFAYIDGPTSQDGTAGAIAVEKFIVASGKCYYWTQEIKSNLKSQYKQWHLEWKDTVKDSLLTPWDTTLPTLQQIGFEALLGPQYDAVHNGIIPTSVLGYINIAPNPFTDNTVIDYTLNVPATLTVEVFNALGQKVASPVPSVFTSNGNYSLTLAGSALAAGTYYVRFSVPEGEVQTVKLVKE